MKQNYKTIISVASLFFASGLYASAEPDLLEDNRSAKQILDEFRQINPAIADDPKVQWRLFTKERIKKSTLPDCVKQPLISSVDFVASNGTPVKDADEAVKRCYLNGYIYQLENIDPEKIVGNVQMVINQMQEVDTSLSIIEYVKELELVVPWKQVG